MMELYHNMGEQVTFQLKLTVEPKSPCSHVYPEVGVMFRLTTMLSLVDKLFLSD